MNHSVPAESQARRAVCLAYDGRVDATAASRRYCRWFFEFVLGQPVCEADFAAAARPEPTGLNAVFWLGTLPPEAADWLAAAGAEAPVFGFGPRPDSGPLRQVAADLLRQGRAAHRWESEAAVVIPAAQHPFDRGGASRYLPRLAAYGREFREPVVARPRAVWPVCIRVDDPPGSWWQRQERLAVLGAADYREWRRILADHAARLTIMYVPATPVGLGYAPWSEAAPEFSESLAELKRGAAEGLWEIGCHGLTHLTVGRRPPRGRWVSWWRRRWRPRHNPTREFYDDLRRRAIPLAAQVERLRVARALAEDLAERPVRSFTPGAHNWDDNTERAAATVGLEYFAADSGFVRFAPGGDFCKNPSPLGTRSAVAPQLRYVSRLLAWPPDWSDVETLHSLGIPLTISAHNYGTTALTPAGLRAFLERLARFENRRHMTVSELGEQLDREAALVADSR